jgi:S-adenosylmethionine decarboxylase
MKRNPLAAHDAVLPTRSAPAWPEHRQQTTAGSPPLDHFVIKDGACFAGTHLILDLWGARYLDDLQRMEAALRECVERCRATLLHIHLHHFTPSGGISGVAVLAESHISVHTWPERCFAAFDIFMCGRGRPEEAVAVLMRTFAPARMQISENRRGIIENEGVC